MKLFHTKFLNKEELNSANKEPYPNKGRINYLLQVLIWAGIFSVAYFIINTLHT
ncbi:MAG: hypothetical protein QM710_13190 [Flavobacterium sp.]